MSAFNKGDRVRLSAAGRKLHNYGSRVSCGKRGGSMSRKEFLARHGTIMSTRRSRYAKILWDGSRGPATFHPDFIEKVPDTEVAAPSGEHTDDPSAPQSDGTSE